MVEGCGKERSVSSDGRGQAGDGAGTAEAEEDQGVCVGRVGGRDCGRGMCVCVGGGCVCVCVCMYEGC